MRWILPLVCVVGIFNPILDRTMVPVAGMEIAGGWLSMMSLILKGIYAVLAAYLLIATTSIEDLCYALRCLKVPKILVTIIMLIDRYFLILGEEADRIMTAYKLRAPKQKGIHYKAWGPLVGQWLIRSMDRAEVVYESMSLRGFRGDFVEMRRRALRGWDVAFLFIWIAVFMILRHTDLVEVLGQVFV